MKKALLSLAVAGVALSAAQGAFAQINNGSQTPVTVHRPRCEGKDSFFPLFQAYFATAGPLFDNTGNTRNPNICANINVTFTGPDSVAGKLPGNRRWCGALQEELLTRAHPGIFALKAKSRSANDNRQVIDVNCFVAPRSNELGNTVVVQNIRLIKTVGFSRKCPDVFPEVASGRGPQYIQFGNNIRTWWTLLYSPPGTRFDLEVTYQVMLNTGKTIFRTDRWRWEVSVTFESIRALIDMLHASTLGTSELPCIVAEEMYIALLNHLDRLRAAVNTWVGSQSPADLQTAQNRAFEMEALIVAFCVFDGCVDAQSLYLTKFPPPNEVTQTTLGAAGIIDTFENPCCCKLLVDIEKLGEQLGIFQPGLPF